VLPLWGLPIALIPLFPRQATALALLACVGIGNALVDVGLFTLMARLAPDEVLARVFGLFESLITLAAGLGALVASLLIEWTSVTAALIIVGVLCPSLVLLAWLRLRHLDRYIGELDSEIGLLHGVPMFQPLPLPAIEQLARGLEPIHVPAGQAVFAKVIRPTASTSSRPARRMLSETVAYSRSLVQETGSERLRCCAGCHVQPRFVPPATWSTGADVQPLPSGPQARGRRTPPLRQCSTDSTPVTQLTMKTGRDTSAEIH
jgi:hypothetical protein